MLLIDASGDKSFQQNSVKTVRIKTNDIGIPQYIIIRHEDKTNGWYIDYVEVSVSNRSIRFLLFKLN